MFDLIQMKIVGLTGGAAGMRKQKCILVNVNLEKILHFVNFEH